MVRDIVYKLEVSFDGLHGRMKASPSAGAEWKKVALSQTLKEIPRIPIAGTESGAEPGFSKYIYQQAGTIDKRTTVIYHV